MSSKKNFKNFIDLCHFYANFMIINFKKIIFGRTDGQPKTIVRNLTKNFFLILF